MFHAVKKSGFRELSLGEIAFIAGGYENSEEGGDIVVTGQRVREVNWLDSGGGGWGFGGGGYGGLGGFGTGGGFSPGLQSLLDLDNNGDGFPDLTDDDPSNDIVVTAQLIQYQPGTDYCGSDFFNAPDVVYGVDISHACYIHDKNYSSGSDMNRDVADMHLLADIYNTLVNNGIGAEQALSVASTYYAAVSIFGVFAYRGNNP